VQKIPAVPFVPVASARLTAHRLHPSNPSSMGSVCVCVLIRHFCVGGSVCGRVLAQHHCLFKKKVSRRVVQTFAVKVPESSTIHAVSYTIALGCV
jgi:hypothetical protein